MIAVERLDEIAARRERLDWPKTDDVRTLVAALRAVLALHKESQSGGWCEQQEGGGSAEVWPCPTVRAITRALGVTS